MMVLFYRDLPETDKKKVTTIHNQPYHEVHGLSEEQIRRGMEIEDSELPEKPSLDDGEKSILYCKPETGEVWWEVSSKRGGGQGSG